MFFAYKRGNFDSLKMIEIFISFVKHLLILVFSDFFLKASRLCFCNITCHIMIGTPL